MEITLKNKCCLYVIITIRFFSITICNLLIDLPSYIYIYLFVCVCIYKQLFISINTHITHNKNINITQHLQILHFLTKSLYYISHNNNLLHNIHLHSRMSTEENDCTVMFVDTVEYSAVQWDSSFCWVLYTVTYKILTAKWCWLYSRVQKSTVQFWQWNCSFVQCWTQ